MSPFEGVEITVNGVQLTTGQIMTVHVALQSFAMDMHKENVLGEDEHGKTMRLLYLDRIREINRLIGKAVDDE